MDNTLTVLASAAAGAAFSFLPQYFLEDKKAKNKLRKYALDRKILAGEKFYEFSGLSVTTFESTLRTLENLGDLTTDKAKAVYIDVEKHYQDMAKAITNTTNTITVADVYYQISGVNDVNKWMAEYQKRMAESLELASLGKLENPKKAIEEITLLLKNIIFTIKTDRETIKIAINQLLNE